MEHDSVIARVAIVAMYPPIAAADMKFDIPNKLVADREVTRRAANRRSCRSLSGYSEHGVAYIRPGRAACSPRKEQLIAPTIRQG
ncbi:MAG: hypothetical protein NVS2B12_28100 [Ktedonobacteraceae bacterium]